MTANFNTNFQKTFKNYTNHYVLIGGTATSIILDIHGFRSRSTKDYDIVITNNNKKFYETLKRFLEEGEYKKYTHDNKTHLYRFTTQNPNYPTTLEIFGPLPDFPLQANSRTIPIQFDKYEYLSAILIDSDYYDLLLEEQEIINNYSVLNKYGLIIFKAKAILDMKTRSKSGEKGLSKKIKKHLNDIVRISILLSEKDALSEHKVSSKIHNDMYLFIQEVENNIDVIPEIKDIPMTKSEIIEILKRFLLG